VREHFLDARTELCLTNISGSVKLTCQVERRWKCVPAISYTITGHAGIIVLAAVQSECINLSAHRAAVQTKDYVTLFLECFAEQEVA
jgi:hypothetical protein